MLAGFVGIPLVVVCLAAVLATVFFLVRYIPHDRVGVLEKRFSRNGSLESGLVALEGEAEVSSEVLDARPGVGAVEVVVGDSEVCLPR